MLFKRVTLHAMLHVVLFIAQGCLWLCVTKLRITCCVYTNIELFHCLFGVLRVKFRFRPILTFVDLNQLQGRMLDASVV